MDDPLTDPLGETVASNGMDSVEGARLRSTVKDALFGDGEAVRIGRYRLVDKIGEGGMGVVYRAHDDELDRDVAIKLLRPDGGGTSKRMLREARSMARLSHPYIAAIYDVGTHEERVYIAMEFVEGPSLRAWLGEPRRFEDIRDVMLQAARGLVAAHGAGVVHRDFKPDNVIVGNDGRVRVLDFGLAKLAQAELGTTSDAATQAGKMMGTPRYMAPEQLRQRPAGPEADQFAFCIVLYEAVFGHTPFPGDVFAEVAASVLGGKPTPPPADHPAPPELWPLLQRGLALEAGNRFDSMHALAEALAAVAGGASAAVVSRPALRDARDQARDQLAGAFAHSLLNADELDVRLERLENAHSPDTVEKLVADLHPAPAVAPASNLPAIPEPPPTGKLNAIFSGTKRAGHWQPARHNKVTAFCGGIDLDFRDVELPPGETVVELQI
ncbi:MAG: protein kinase, partial [Myxococcota bacterium]